MILSGCGAAQDAADTVARERAKTVVNSVVSERFPSVNPAPVTDCIIDAASAGEILRLGSAGVTGITPDTVDQVVEISTRPESVTCIAKNTLTTFGGLS